MPSEDHLQGLQECRGGTPSQPEGGGSQGNFLEQMVLLK